MRPGPAGTDTVVQMRHDAAPQAVSWNVALQPGQELKKLSTGAVAVVVPAEAGAPAPDPETLPAEPTAAQRKQALSDTDLAITLAEEELERAQTSTADEIVALVPKPWALDANNQSIAATLDVSGSTVSLNLPHTSSSSFPITTGTQLQSRDGTETATAARTVDQIPAAAFNPSPGAPPAPTATTGTDDPEDDEASNDGGSAFEDEDGPQAAASAAGRAAADPTKNFNTAALASLRVGVSAGDPELLRNTKLSGDGGLNPQFIRPFAPFNTTKKPNTTNAKLWDQWVTEAKRGRAAAPLKGDVAITRDKVMEEGGAKNFSAATYGRYLNELLSRDGDPDGNGDPVDGVVNNLMAWNEPNFKNGSSKNNKKGDPTGRSLGRPPDSGCRP